MFGRQYLYGSLDNNAGEKVGLEVISILISEGSGLDTLVISEVDSCVISDSAEKKLLLKGKCWRLWL